MKTKNRTHRILSAAAVLLCLVLVSSHFNFGMLARYVTRANGSDTARIAALQVSAETVPKENENSFLRSYEVTLRNDSDVAVRYEASPLLTLTNGDKSSAGVAGDEKHPVKDGVFSGDLAPHSSETVTLTLDLTQVEMGTDAFATFDNTDISFTAELSFTVTVTFTQIN